MNMKDKEAMAIGYAAIATLKASPGVVGNDGKPDPLQKPTKPAGWTAPDAAVLLSLQGWSP